MNLMSTSSESELVIRVQDLGKAFKIGALQSTQTNSKYTSGYRTLRDELAGLPKRLLAPFTRRSASQDGGYAGGHDSKYEILWALREVSFNVPRGQVLGIIGRNGSGKSTLLKILSRVTEPSEGSVEIRGRVGSLLEVGTGFHPELTGRENIFLNGAILGMKRSEIQRKFDEIVAFSEVEKFIDTPVKRYSSGMYLRLAFSVAAHLEPEILVVDEVLAVGDAEFQRKCLGKMGEVAREGRTVLFVSHDMSAILRLTEESLVLDKGHPLAEFLERRVPESVAALIAASLLFVLPVNLRQGRFTMSWEEAVRIDWGTILLFGSGLSLGKLMFDTGVAEALGHGVVGLTGAHSLWGLTAAAVAMGIFLSETTSNTSATNMLVPVVIAIAQAAGVNPVPPALGACFGANYGFMLPVSVPPNAIVYSSGLVPITKMMRAGVLFDLLGFFLVLGCLRVLCPLLGFAQ